MNDKIVKTIFDKSSKGKTGYILPKLDVPEIPLDFHLDKKLLKKKSSNMPQLTEPEVVRHFVNLSVKNHHVDKDFYPLGSCTMKYNPKINDSIASMVGFSGMHPEQSPICSQGSLKLMLSLQSMLLKITGMDSITLQPSAGSQGEFVGILMMKKFHNQKGNIKDHIIIPETAHGTNPASVVLGGYKTVQVRTDDRGRVDVEDLKSKITSKTAGMMLTQPNTLGLYEDRILEITDLIHKVDGLMYMDGANLNALVGLCYPKSMGFDIVHINLHKTFSTPHGGGGPGSGPIAVVKKLSQYLPIPIIKKDSNENYSLNYNLENSIGPIHSFYGNFGILVRAYVYISILGEDGVKKMTRRAILNANYLKKRLLDYYDVPYPNGSMHEFVISGIKQKKRGVKVLDIAKILLDYGYHAPTIYFPMNVPESMMIEPTESETKETLDEFADTLIEIDSLIDKDPSILTNAPHKTCIKRLDETKANREPILKWIKNESN